MSDDTSVKVATIVALTVVVVAAIAGMTVVAVATDRSLFRVEVMTFSTTVLLAAFGGVSWWGLRRRAWHLRVDRNGSAGDASPPPPPLDHPAGAAPPAPSAPQAPPAVPPVPASGDLPVIDGPDLDR